jgi:hypothetical protein
MIKMIDCVVLDNVVCQGITTGSASGHPVFWRSAWLRPLDGEDGE